MFHNGQDVFSISSAMLPRGKACLNCKHRKMKCDGEQPMCGPCTRLERRDCEYIQGKARSSTHGLEKKITGLRSRLKELQGVGGESGRHSNPPTAVPAPTPATGLSDPLYKPSSQEVSQLMDVFFSRDTQLWFLHRDRFRNAATLSQDRPDPAPAALVYAVCLAGAVSAPPSTACEAALLARAISSLNDALSRDPLAALQTHILLAAYLLSCGRILEGRTQLSSAASLALSCGLHHTRSRRGCTPGGPIEPIPLTTLPAPRDQITEGERINGFWTTLTLERIWGAALGVPGRIQPASPPFSQGAGVRVDLPWPLVMDQYEQGWIDRSMLSSDTIWNFMRGGIGTWEEANALTLTTKSAILLERSLANVNDPAEIQALDRHITKLCPVTAADPRGRAANILLRGAIMYLHSRDIRAVEAARDLAAIAGTLRPAPKDMFGFLEAAVAAVVPRACRLLIAVSATRLDPSTNHQLDALQNVLAAWAQRSPFIDVQLSRVQQERDSL